MKQLIRIVNVAALGIAVTLLSGCGENKQAAVSTQTDAPVAGTIPPAANPAPVATTAATTSLEDMTPLGLPLYPHVYESGMTPDLKAFGALAGAMTGTEVKVVPVRVGQMYSHDPFDDVYAFYRKEMPAGSESAEAAASTHTTDDGRAAMFEVGVSGQPGYQRVLVMHGKADDFTLIHLASMPSH